MYNISIQKQLYGSQGKMQLAVNLHLVSGSFNALMGESGSGKTTLLRILAGLEKADGEIVIDGQIWLSKRVFLPPQKREIGFVFQDYALFENMNVLDNLLYVNPDKALAQELLVLTKLDTLSHRNVKSLSGGQQQRVSLCRAMMHTPKLLLMDEPFSALDEKMKHTLIEMIALFHKKYATTTIMVSHDAEASYLLADRVVVLDGGCIVQEGTPSEVFTATQKVVYHL